jgi:DNA primase large subunit
MYCPHGWPKDRHCRDCVDERNQLERDARAFRDAKHRAATEESQKVRERDREIATLRASLARAEAERDEWHRQYIMMSEAQASALSGESEAVRRAEAAELGCEIAYRREPTQAEGDAHEDNGHDCDDEDCQRCAHLAPLGIKSGECFVPMGGWTGRRCRRCRRWAWGGPTAARTVTASALASSWRSGRRMPTNTGP